VEGAIVRHLWDVLAAYHRLGGHYRPPKAVIYMASPSPEITREDMRDALLRSGYLLEARLSGTLHNSGWAAEANHAYPDPRSGTSRELDVFEVAYV
jgi:hypothetical protein